MSRRPSFVQRAFTESRIRAKEIVPVSEQIDDLEHLYNIAISLARSDADLLALTHRLAVYADMDLNYRGDLLEWSKPFSEMSTAYSHEYMDILSDICGEE